jgi:hypothetical protein
MNLAEELPDTQLAGRGGDCPMKLATATKLYKRLARANLEPRLEHRLDGDNNAYEIEILGSSGWMTRSDLARLLKLLDSFDEAGRLEIELRPDTPLRVR